MPFNLLPAIDDFRFLFDGKKADIEAAREGVPDQQSRVLELMLALYSHTNKIHQYLDCSPIVAFESYPELIDILNQGSGTSLRVPDENRHDYLLQLFFVARRYQDLHDQRLKLLPFVDLTDHHAYAEPFKPVTGVANPYIEVSKRPVQGAKGQLLVSYGVMDALDSFVSYGFVDFSAFFIRSVPFLFEYKGVKFKIRRDDVMSGQLPSSDWSFSNPDARFYASKAMFDDLNQLTINYLLVPNVNHSEACDEVYKRYFLLAEKQLGLKAGEINNQHCLEEFRRKIVASNRDYYRSLSACAKQYVAGESSLAVKGLAQLLKHQAKLLRSYEAAA